MNEEIILTKNIAHVHIYKGQDVLLYSRDKVFEVLDNNDTISIILSKIFCMKRFDTSLLQI